MPCQSRINLTLLVHFPFSRFFPIDNSSYPISRYPLDLTGKTNISPAMRRKGKVHPSPSASASSSASASASAINKDAQSVLKLLPTAILTIVSVLSLDDREVLAYMIARSIKSTNPSAHYLQHNNVNKNSDKLAFTAHKPPVFDCECFDCYTSYWYRWDSSPNRELIHQAIEAFEEHLYKRELPARKGKNKKKDKFECRRVGGKVQEETEAGINLTLESCVKQTASETGFSQPEPADLVTEKGENVESLSEKVLLDEEVERQLLPEPTVVVLQGGGGNNHKGLARKVLPDVLGLFNSRLWNLWGPNV